MGYKSVVFDVPQGAVFEQELVKSSVTTADAQRKVTIINPSIMDVGYIPVIGDTAQVLSGNKPSNAANSFNANLQHYYVKLRGANASINDYTAADIGKCLIALDSLYGLWAELERDIIALNAYEYKGVAYRGLLPTVLWRDPKAASMNLADIIAHHNNLVDKLKVILFVPGIKYLSDHLDFARYIYKDDNMDKSSLIVFRRSGYWRWEVRSDDVNPGELLLTNTIEGNGYSTISKGIYAEDKFEIIERLIQDYILDDDFMKISAEIAHAYGITESNYALPYMPNDISKFTVETKYDLDVIDSLRSADFNILEHDYSVRSITEDTNGHLGYSSSTGIAPDHEFAIAPLALNRTVSPATFTTIDTGDSRVIYSYEADPSEEAISVITRYVHQYKDSLGQLHRAHVFGLNSEYLTSFTYHYLDSDGQFTWVNFPSFVCRSKDVLSNDKVRNIVAAFIASPRISIYNIPADEWVQGVTHYGFDLDNIATIPNAYLLTLSNKRMFDLFCIPGSGTKKTNKKDFDKKS